MNRRDLLKYSGAALASLVFAKVTPNTINFIEGLDEGKDKKPLLLNFNENSLGLSPKAKKAVEESLKEAFRYPDTAIEELCQELIKKFNFKREEIILAPGSCDVLRATTQAWIVEALAKKEPVQLILPTPTFDLIADYTKRMNLGINIVRVPLNANYEMNIEKMKEIADQFQGISICYLCNPNNPTGNLTPSASMFDWVKNSNINKQYFIMDEAYAEYVTVPSFVSGMELVKKEQPNIIVTKTFSKVYAMAGLRVGYGFATPKLTEQIRAYSDYDGLNTAGVHAAIASLHDIEYYKKSLASNQKSKNIVENALNELEISYLPSQTNFIFYQIKGDLSTYIERMKSYNVFVGRKFPPLLDWNRLTLGTPQEMERFVKILKEFRIKGWI